jgi:hypothetical protein
MEEITKDEISGTTIRRKWLTQLRGIDQPVLRYRNGDGGTRRAVIATD